MSAEKDQTALNAIGRSWRIAFQARSAVRLPRQTPAVSLNLPDAMVTLLTKYRVDEFGTIVTSNLLVTVEVTVDDPLAALQKAIARADYAASLLSFIGAAPVERPRLHTLYEVRADNAPRHFEQYFHDLPDSRNMRKVPPEHVSVVHAALEKLGQKPQARFARAIMQYRLAIDEPDLLERFMLIMTAFEVLNPLLAKHLKVQSSREVECPNCAHKQRIQFPKGIYTWLDSECGKEKSKLANLVRQGYVHGKNKDLHDLEVTASELCPHLELALAKALIVLSGVDGLVESRRAYAARLPFNVAFRGKIRGPIEAGVAAGHHPEFIGSLGIVGSRNTGPDNEWVELTLTLPTTASFPEGVSVDIDGFVRAADATAEIEMQRQASEHERTI